MSRSTFWETHGRFIEGDRQMEYYQSVGEAVADLGVSEYTIRKLLKEGKLTGTRMGILGGTKFRVQINETKSKVREIIEENAGKSLEELRADNISRPRQDRPDYNSFNAASRDLWLVTDITKRAKISDSAGYKAVNELKLKKFFTTAKEYMLSSESAQKLWDHFVPKHPTAVSINNEHTTTMATDLKAMRAQLNNIENMVGVLFASLTTNGK